MLKRHRTVLCFAHGEGLNVTAMVYYYKRGGLQAELSERIERAKKEKREKSRPFEDPQGQPHGVFELHAFAIDGVASRSDVLFA